MTDIFEEIRQEGKDEMLAEIVEMMVAKGWSSDAIKDFFKNFDEEIDILKLTFPSN